MPRPEGPFERLLKQKPERDPAPIIIGGTVAFLAIVIVMVFVFSSVFGGDDDGGGGTVGGGNSGDCREIVDNVQGCLATIPTLPPGLAQASDFFEFESERDISVDVGFPLTDNSTDPSGLGFYTYDESRWQRVADATLVPAQDFAVNGCVETDLTGETGGLIGCGNFSSVPRNIAVLRVVAQAYQVFASVPHGAAMHPDAAAVQVITPRDFTPASDGTLQGTATNVERDGGVLLMPTVIGSSADTSAVVNDILADESLRAQHVTAIAGSVTNGNLDGINLEYSSIDVDLAPEFTSFIVALANSLHGSDKRLMLTLPPPTNQRLAYEWEKLGEAVDFIQVLPIADPIAYWDNMPSALSRITTDYRVNPRKVFLIASPFSIEGQGDAARPMGYLQAMALASTAAVREPTNPEELKPGTEVKLVAKNLDEGEGASPMTWNTDALTVSFALGGTDRRRIFVENSYSVAFKLELVQAYGLGGVAISDGSAQSDVANVWPTVNDFVRSATVNLRRPNNQMLLPTWQAPEGGNIGTGTGTNTTWVAPSGGQYHVVLGVSDGDRRFGQEILIEVRAGESPSPTVIETFAPESDTPTPPPGTVTETPIPGTVLVQVGIVAEGDDDDPLYSNEEIVSPGSTITYLVTIDNDSDSPVTVTGLSDDTYPDMVCLGTGDANIVGTVLGADDGDGGDLDGGTDEAQCIFTVTAGEPGQPITNTVTGAVEDDFGTSDTDRDSATITVQ